ncbi:ParB/RepB/Spo0J family partition protein [Flavobacteriaceae bacterium]|nr:ParB/RepB/Spo0J family partition protein [Flavobacteriaceae bacterium]
MSKSNRKPALGRGLSALLNDSANIFDSIKDKNDDQIIGKIIDLPIEKINTNPFQPRSNFNDETLKELSNSILELGIIQPVTVRKTKEEYFELISGERRYKASKMAGLKTIPAFVRLADDKESLEMALVENIQREDLDPIEIGLSYRRLIEEINLTQDQLSDRVGKKRSTITNYMRLLKLDPIIQTGIRDRFISMGHGRALVNVEDTKTQLDLYKQIVKKGLSVRATENLVRNSKEIETSSSSKFQPPFISLVAAELGTLFNTSVTANANSQGKGTLKISFESQEQLQRILNIVKK